MRKILFILGLLFLGNPLTQAEGIKWMTWTEAIQANKKKPKLIFVDVYTSWCGWCKVMDQKTFSDPDVAKYMSDNFYCVKFDAEQKEPIEYNKHTFVFKPEYKSHELAMSMLENQMSYPSFVFFNKKEQRIQIVKGYQETSIWMNTLKSVVEGNK